MALTLNGTANTISGLAVGGLPDGIVDTDMLAADAVTDAKQDLNGAAKAWIKYDMNANSIANSYNVSSITDSGTGLFNANFSTAMPNANYVTVTGYVAYLGWGEGDLRWSTVVDNQTTTYVRSRCREVANGGSHEESRNVMVAVFGD